MENIGFVEKAEVLGAAGLVKQLAGQINVVIHALGILLCLPHILRPGEIIEYVSLGAGNTGRAFDLETNRRVAEFKFIHWQGGPELIRQNSLFKDFYQMAEHDTTKERYLYVLGTALLTLNDHNILVPVEQQGAGAPESTVPAAAEQTV